MAVQIAIDIIDGDGARKTRTGCQLDRIATVYGLTGTGNQRTMAAIEWIEGGSLLAEGAITINTPHPYKATAYLTDFEPMAISADAVKIRLVYKEYPFGDRVIRVGATTSQVVTNRGFLVNEADDKPATTLTDMKVKYTFPANYEGVNKEKYAGKTFETGVEASRFTPNRTIVVTRQEVVTAQYINDMADDFVGRIGSSGWLLAPGDPAGVWLCAGIEGISNDNGLSYVITYSFQHRSDFWEQTVIYIDPNIGRPPKDLAPGTPGTTTEIGSKNRYAVQNSADFNDLGLE